MAKSDTSSVASLLQDMDKLKELLDTYHFKDNNRIELTDLEGIVNTIRANIGKKKKMYFTTGTEGITFHSLTTGMNPNPGIKEQKIDLILSLHYEYNCDKKDLKELLKNYFLDIRIKGVNMNLNSHNIHYFEWLQDVLSPPQKQKNRYQFIHPYYHFHAGGKFLKEKAPGSLLQLNTPRLPHPPMDIVLAVNFIICNFYSTKESKFQKEMRILDDKDYQELVKRAAKRLYYPYFKEIFSDITSSEYMPLFTI